MDMLLVCLFAVAAYEIVVRRYFRREVRRIREAQETTAWVDQLREWNLRDCYCCSCPDGQLDPYCRNHGGSQGLRPCLVHGQPGRRDEEGRMPLPVGDQP